MFVFPVWELSIIRWSLPSSPLFPVRLFSTCLSLERYVGRNGKLGDVPTITAQFKFNDRGAHTTTYSFHKACNRKEIRQVLIKPSAAVQAGLSCGILFRSLQIQRSSALLPVLVHHVRDGLPEIIQAPGYFHLAPVLSRRPSAADSDLKPLFWGVRCVVLPVNPGSSSTFSMQL